MSIHDSGENQFGFTPEARRSFNLPSSISEFPSFVRWKRKRPEPGMIVPAASLQFPTDYLRGSFPVISTTSNKPKSYIEPAPPGHCAEIAFLIIQNPKLGQKLDCKGPYNVFLQLTLGEDELCLVGLRSMPFNKDLLPDFNNLRIPTAWLTAMNGGPPKDGWFPFSATLWSHPQDYEAIGLGEISGFHMNRIYETES
ncbi:hypothetical protein [Albidovulum sp.]|uniref:hypothetical protein n=1 Tax=Albidovulum sp. TaxID=1872424 RepID=UPI0039B86800